MINSRHGILGDAIAMPRTHMTMQHENSINSRLTAHGSRRRKLIVYTMTRPALELWSHTNLS